MALAQIGRVQRVISDLEAEGRQEDAQAVDELLQAIVAQEKGTGSGLMTTTKAARRLSCSRQTVVNWVKAGLLPGVRVGGRYMVPESAFDQFRVLEQIFDQMEVERSTPSDRELVKVISRGREGWVWVGKDET